jgi:phosphoribosylanthranilate isomerase
LIPKGNSEAFWDCGVESKRAGVKPAHARLKSMATIENRSTTPQVKVCGLTRVDEALACAELGVHAIGCVFYPPSPRHVSAEQAREIFLSLPPSVCSVVVFVNDPFAVILEKIEQCGLKAVQLHGQESAALAGKLRKEGVVVIKAVFANGTPPLSLVGSFGASAYLIECAGGPLPGGNALAWEWSAAAGISANHPVILAGGLNAHNVSQAIQEALPDAIDVSSGVEFSPGRKDMDKVKRLLEAVASTHCSRQPRRIFP